ncbi:MAG: hypothetical protein FWB72_00145 [Firmicutes bacterium]|nr:hypothetical protein [Bacillota bacterium]
MSKTTNLILPNLGKELSNKQMQRVEGGSDAYVVSEYLRLSEIASNTDGWSIDRKMFFGGATVHTQIQDGKGFMFGIHRSTDSGCVISAQMRNSKKQSNAKQNWIYVDGQFTPTTNV